MKKIIIYRLKSDKQKISTNYEDIVMHAKAKYYLTDAQASELRNLGNYGKIEINQFFSK